jgi:hypothetical protein
LESLGTRQIEVLAGDFSKAENQAEIKYSVSYTTKYGKLDFESVMEFIKENNQWRMVWDWDYVLPGYTPGTKIEIQEGTIPLAKIVDSRGRTLATRGDWKMVYIFPRVMFDWNKYLADLAKVTGDEPHLVDRRIRQVVPDHFLRFAGYVNPALGQEGLRQAADISGVHLRGVQYLNILAGDLEEVAKFIKAAQETSPELFYQRAQVYLEKDGQKIPLVFAGVESKDIVLQF